MKCELCNTMVNSNFKEHLLGNHFSTILRSTAKEVLSPNLAQKCQFCERSVDDLIRHLAMDHSEALRCYRDALCYGEHASVTAVTAYNSPREASQTGILPQQQTHLHKQQQSNQQKHVVSLLKPKIMRSNSSTGIDPMANKDEDLSFSCRMCTGQSPKMATEKELKQHLSNFHFSKFLTPQLQIDDLLERLKMQDLLRPTVPTDKEPHLSTLGNATSNHVRRSLSRLFCKSFSHLQRCLLCNFKEDAAQTGPKKGEMIKHLYKCHYQSTMTDDIVRRVKAKEGKLLCPSCKEGFDCYDVLTEHWAVHHKRVLYEYEKAWEEKRSNALQKKKVRRGSQDSEEGSEEEIDENVEGEEEYYVFSELRAQRELRYWSEGSGKGRPFVQRHPCHLIQGLQGCRECTQVELGAQTALETICQFEGFRKIEYKFQRFQRYGFLSPKQDPTQFDKDTWLPIYSEKLGERLDEETALFILDNVAEDFCKLVRQEEKAKAAFRALNGSSQAPAIWKRMEVQVREMCDVCSTTLFNVHFTCPSCCVLVCLDCFQTRLTGCTEYKSDSANAANPYRSLKRRRLQREDLDEHMWPFCHGEVMHDPSALLLTTMIPDDLHLKLRDTLHDTMKTFGRKLSCFCEEKSVARDVLKSVVGQVAKSIDGCERRVVKKHYSPSKSTCDKEYSTKNITLMVDGERKCRLCGKAFDNFYQFRLHLIDHFKKGISSFVNKSRDKTTGKIMCPELGCTYGNKNVDYLIDKHLSIFHRYLDSLYFKSSKEPALNIPQLSIEVKSGEMRREESDMISNNGQGRFYVSESPTKVVKKDAKHVSIQEYKEPSRSCPVCKIEVTERKMSKHLTEHFSEELEALANFKSWKSACPKCSYVGKSRQDVLLHLADGQKHNLLQVLLSDKDLVAKKQSEHAGQARKMEKCPFGCPVGSDIDLASHLAGHFWLKLNQKLAASELTECDACLLRLGGSTSEYFNHLKEEHFELVAADFYPVNKEKLLSERSSSRLESLMRLIMEEKWCCLCEEEMDGVAHMRSHLQRKWANVKR